MAVPARADARGAGANGPVRQSTETSAPPALKRRGAPAASGGEIPRAPALPIRSSPWSSERSLRSSPGPLHAHAGVGKKSPIPTLRTPFVRKPVIQELEARLLLSADLNPAVQETILATPAMQGAEFRALVDTTMPTLVTSAEVAPLQRTHDLVFVDTQTPEYDRLVESMREAASARGRSLEFVLIDGDKDGIRKITDTLAQRSDLDAIHIISHASDGAVQLGSAQLDFESLLKRAASIKKWGDALTDSGDILIYGCDLAASQEGKSLIDALSRLTRADVAASDDPTGAATRGGDWDLEFTTGAIEAEVAVSADEQGAWNHILAEPSYVGNGVLVSAAGATITPALPANIQAGDLLLAVFESQGGQAVSIPTCWGTRASTLETIRLASRFSGASTTGRKATRPPTLRPITSPASSRRSGA
jgi:hypothetical protein